MWFITHLTILISVERCAHEVHRFVRQHLVVHWCQVRAGRKIGQYWNMHEYDVMVINKNCDMPRNSWLHLGLYVWPGKPEIFEASNPMVSCLMIMMILMITIIIRTQWYWWHPLTDAWWHYGCRGLPRSPLPWSWTHCKWWQCSSETNSNLSDH